MLDTHFKGINIGDESPRAGGIQIPESSWSGLPKAKPAANTADFESMLFANDQMKITKVGSDVSDLST